MGDDFYRKEGENVINVLCDEKIMKRKKSFMSFIILGIIAFMTVFEPKNNLSIEALQKNDNVYQVKLKSDILSQLMVNYWQKPIELLKKDSPILKFIGKNLTQA